MANTEPLYPPIMDTAIPIFVSEDNSANARVRFDLSPYQAHSSNQTSETYYFWGGRSEEPKIPAGTPYYGVNGAGYSDDNKCLSTYSVQVIANNQMHNTTVFNLQDFPQEIAFHAIEFRDVDKPPSSWAYNLYCYTITGEEVNGDKGWIPGQYYRTQARLMKDPFQWNGTSIPEPESRENLPDIRDLFGTIYFEIEDARDANCTYKGEENHGFQEMCEKYLVESFKTVCWAAHERGEWSKNVSPITLLRQAITKRRELIDWYEENNFVSEWSTICMIRSIHTPVWTVNSLTVEKNIDNIIYPAPPEDNQYENYYYGYLDFNSPLISLSGNIEIPEDGLEPETIDTIKIQVFEYVMPLPSNPDDPPYVMDSPPKERKTLRHYSRKKDEVTIQLNSQDASNTFYYKLDTMLRSSVIGPTHGEGNTSYPYCISISAVSRNGWTGSVDLFVHVNNSSDSFEDIVLSCVEDNARGCIDMTVTTGGDDGFQSLYDYAVVRSENTDGNRWEELHILKNLEICNAGETKTLSWMDTTAESGTQYRYGLQQIDRTYGYRGDVYILDKDGRMKAPGSVDIHPLVLIPFYEDMFLSNENATLAISYGQALTSYKTNIKEASIETIGSPYPFYYRNEIVNYRTVQLSGIISYNDNNEERIFSIDAIEGTPYSSRMGKDNNATSSATTFANNNLVEDNFNKGFRAKEDLFGQKTLENYAEFNFKNRINNMNDITLERAYRKEVIKFLQDGKPKLLKTAAEGNILVILMNITFTPKTEINNIVYDFTCDAIEIDECNIDNYNKYNIQYLNDSHLSEVD